MNRFTKRISTRVWNGELFIEEIRWGGTQKLDRFFALEHKQGLPRKAPTAGKYSCIKLFVFTNSSIGLADTTCLSCGKLRQVEREAPGSLTWASLAQLLSVDHTVQKEFLEEEASVEARRQRRLTAWCFFAENSSKTFAGSLAR